MTLMQQSILLVRYCLVVIAISITLGNQAIAQTNPEAFNRTQITIVGSSTVYPFASSVAEEFGMISQYPTPFVESNGTGGGFKLFCAGVGKQTPDIVNASRRITLAEYKNCYANGVKKITQVNFGYDGIVLAEKKGNAPFAVTRLQLLLAVAKDVPNAQGTALIPNPYSNWNQIDATLPNRAILIYGPPVSSGTRDAFAERLLQPITREIPLYQTVNKRYSKIREDGKYIPSGENDNLIVSRLTMNTDAFGIFGYHYFVDNNTRIQGSLINNIAPTHTTIADGTYLGARKLYFYVKNDHIGRSAGLKFFIKLFSSDNMIGPNGKLTRIGLVPLPDSERSVIQKKTPETLSF